MPCESRNWRDTPRASLMSGGKGKLRLMVSTTGSAFLTTNVAL